MVPVDWLWFLALVACALFGYCLGRWRGHREGISHGEAKARADMIGQDGSVHEIKTLGDILKEAHRRG